MKDAAFALTEEGEGERGLPCWLVETDLMGCGNKGPSNLMRIAEYCLPFQ